MADKAGHYIILPAGSLSAASLPYSVDAEIHTGIEKNRLLIDFQDTGFSVDELTWKVRDRPFFSTAYQLYIEIYYNRVRKHSANNWLTPVEKESRFYKALEKVS